MHSRRGSVPLRQGLSLALFGLLILAAIRTTMSATLERADFTFINGAEVSSLDPASVTGQPEGRMIRSLFEGLVIKHPQTLEPMPGMAESWELSDDGLVYTFHIRKGCEWNNRDGNLPERYPDLDWEITAADFEWSFERFLHPRTAAEYSYQLWYVTGAKAFSTETDENGDPLNDFAETVGIEATDRYTLEMRLNSPTPFFLDLVGFYPLFPVCRHNIEIAQREYPDTWELEWIDKDNIIGNGPYKVAERWINDRIRLVKNEKYWNADTIAFDTVDVLALDSYSTMLNLYLTSEVDWIDRLATNVVPRMMAREDFNPTPYLSTYFYRVNVTKPPTDDVRVRRALALTIDRRAITQKITKAGQPPSYSLVPPGLVGYKNGEMRRTPQADDSAEAYRRAFAADCEEAAALIAEAGYGPKGKPFPSIEIHYNTSEAHRDIAEVIGATWKRVLGVDVKLLNQEWKVYLDTQSNLDYDVSRAGWIADYADPNTYLDLFVTDGENNKTGWGNPRYDELIAQAAVELDAPRRMEILSEAETLLMEELPILPVYSYVDQNVVNQRLGGWYNNATDEHFPQFWYWLSDEELAAKRASYSEGVELAPTPGPAGGQRGPGGLGYVPVEIP